MIVATEVAEALEAGRPVVALESALITHGFSKPYNLEIARRMQEAVREEGAEPALIAVLKGEVHVGLNEGELLSLASDFHAEKISLRDLPLISLRGGNGGTTVAATMHLAHRSGIAVFATGGIGGIHRGHSEDVSADLTALASIPIVVVCSGAKAILDLPRTLEMLETLGVPVLGYGSDEFPAFYSRHSGLPADAQVSTPEEVVQVARARSQLGLRTAVLVAVPVPQEDELPAKLMEAAIALSLVEADKEGVKGKQLTPYLLSNLVERTTGQARRANESLLINNARVAAHIAQAISARP